MGTLGVPIGVYWEHGHRLTSFRSREYAFRVRISMKYAVSFLAVLFCLAMVCPAGAQAPGPQGALTGLQTAPSTGLLKSGLIDLSRLELSHSLSYSFSSASGLGSRSGGLWQTRAAYRVADPLEVAVDVAAAIDPTGDGPVLGENSFFLKGFEVDWKPANAFHLNISYQNIPANAAAALGYGPNGLGHLWGSPLGLDR